MKKSEVLRDFKSTLTSLTQHKGRKEYHCNFSLSNSIEGKKRKLILYIDKS